MIEPSHAPVRRHRAITIGAYSRTERSYPCARPIGLAASAEDRRRPGGSPQKTVAGFPGTTEIRNQPRSEID
ncbi:hypothetical protein FRAAL2889 [Frankia alni ACN14a]|uniref:Uncharacterized protein n=1 Tax=Frankia alni (strain DSM 45986 / CECT 9034 / ACN14a) TaxID=326424 RepID=Q0RLS1_FRAAA|nr:hypothetical protein FRAAL2889 [Frankia alni ACN14a]